MAYALLALGGNNGIVTQLFPFLAHFPRLSGYWGALLALSAYTSPYLFLNLRSALLGLDPSLEESARSLGYRYREVFFHVILPQLRPAFYASGLLISLHVLGDFGVVSLMRYETFSYALYTEYLLSFEHISAAWLALMLLAFTASLLYLEARLLKRMTLHRAGRGAARHLSLVPLGENRTHHRLFLPHLLNLRHRRCSRRKRSLLDGKRRRRDKCRPHQRPHRFAVRCNSDRGFLCVPSGAIRLCERPLSVARLRCVRARRLHRLCDSAAGIRALAHLFRPAQRAVYLQDVAGAYLRLHLTLLSRGNRTGAEFALSGFAAFRRSRALTRIFTDAGVFQNPLSASRPWHAHRGCPRFPRDDEGIAVNLCFYRRRAMSRWH